MLFTSQHHLDHRSQHPHFSSSAQHIYPHTLEFDYLDSCDTKGDPQLMSTPFYDFTDPSGDCSPDLFEFDHAQEDTFGYPTQGDTTGDLAWQFWSNGGYNQVPHIQQQNQHDPPQQQYYGAHGRALSTSSDLSFSPGSPYSQASSIQYPSTYNHRPQYLAPSWDACNSPATPVQHLPTPVHTPTSDVFMETKSGRRTRKSHTPDSALAAHRSMRSALTHQSSSGIINGSGNFPVPQGMAQFQNMRPTYGQAGNGEASQIAQVGSNVSRHVPKFDRTMSDIYQDELYNPPTATSMPTSASNATNMPAPQQPASSQQHAPKSSLQTPHNLVTDRLNAAYLERSSSPGHQSRGPSPYAQASTYSTVQESDSSQIQPRTAAGVREQNKARADAIAYAQHLSRDDPQQQQTVSPKDTCPADYMPEEENLPSLFPASSNQSGTSETTAIYGPHNAEQPYDFNSSLPYGNLGFATPSVPASQLPNLTSVRRGRRRGHESASADGGDAEYPASPPARLVSMDTTNSDSEDMSDDMDSPARPSDPTARVGTYTCTYHGCTERFRTPSELQKHKRDDHRSTGASGFGPAAVGSSSPNNTTSSMTQAGPHKCTRINPSTNKPCNTVFSRPYDLTRHEDTIHAERKKVRCPHCDEEKTFSRADALTRHLRVVHPHVSFPGKHRKRHD